jgi:hypothetical protein
MKNKYATQYALDTTLLLTLFVFSLRIVVSNAYCVAYLFFMSSSSCVAYVASFSGLSILSREWMLDLGAGGVKSTTINLAFAEFVKE